MDRFVIERKVNGLIPRLFGRGVFKSSVIRRLPTTSKIKITLVDAYKGKTYKDEVIGISTVLLGCTGSTG